MTTKFNILMEKYFKLLSEEESTIAPPPPQAPMGDSPPMSTPDAGMPPPGASGAPPAPQQGNKTVTQGYAHVANIIFNLFKTKPTEEIKNKYSKLSDNQVADSKQAYSYLGVLEKMLTNGTMQQINKQSFGKQSKDSIGVDDSKIVEMANVAIKALFFTPKDNFTFTTHIDDIDNILSKNGNKVTTENAYAVYTAIKEKVEMG